MENSISILKMLGAICIIRQYTYSFQELDSLKLDNVLDMKLVIEINVLTLFVYFSLVFSPLNQDYDVKILHDSQ